MVVPTQMTVEALRDIVGAEAPMIRSGEATIEAEALMKESEIEAEAPMIRSEVEAEALMTEGEVVVEAHIKVIEAVIKTRTTS